MATSPYQSKLIPHEDFIRQCRVRRWSYPRIAAALLEKHGLKVGATTIFDFVKVRAKKRTMYALPEQEPNARATKTSIFPSDNQTLADGFFEKPSPQPPKSHEKRKLYNLDF